VEVADHGNRVSVRDTKNRAGTVLRFTPDAWRRFADRVKRSLASPRREGLRRADGRHTATGELEAQELVSNGRLGGVLHGRGTFVTPARAISQATHVGQ
jgi:Domain of unknown function (DUF397)